MRKTNLRILKALYLEQTMDRLQLGCQTVSAVVIGSGICDGTIVVVVGSGIVSVSSDSNIPTQLSLKFTTFRCTMRYKRQLFRNIVRHFISCSGYITSTAH